MEATTLSRHVARYVELGRNGRGPCPIKEHVSFHPFAVFTAKSGGERWHCHACGEGGGIIDFEAAILQVPRRTAFKALLAEYGIKEGRPLTRRELAALRRQEAQRRATRMRVYEAGRRKVERLEEAMERVGDAALRANPADPWADDAAAELMGRLADLKTRELARFREAYGENTLALGIAKRRQDDRFTPAALYGVLEEWREYVRGN